MLGFALLLSTAFAYAAANHASSQQARKQLAALEESAEHRRLAAEPIARAEDALKRAEDARAAGDAGHAALLNELGLEWANTARDVVRSAELEAKAAAVEKQARDVETKAVRALAIVEEAVARKGRAQDELKQQTQATSPGTESAQ